jgi:histidine ammonia-lyase
LSETVFLTGDTLTLEDLVAVARRGFHVALAPEAVARVEAARAVIDRAVADERVVYGQPAFTFRAIAGETACRAP